MGIDQGTADSSVCLKKFMSFSLVQTKIRKTGVPTSYQHAHFTPQPGALAFGSSFWWVVGMRV